MATKVKVESKDLVAAAAVNDAVEQREPKRGMKGGAYHAARRMAEDFLFHPMRVSGLLTHFYKRAYQNDAVLLRAMQVLLPAEGQGASTTIVINSSVLVPREKSVRYDLEGKVIDATVAPVEAKK